MKVLFFNDTLDIYLIPIEIPLIRDILTLELRNEVTNDLFYPNFTFTLTDLNVKITLLEHLADFKMNNKYSFVLKNGVKIIYIGKMICLENGTNIQTYEYGSQTNGRFQYT